MRHFDRRKLHNLRLYNGYSLEMMARLLTKKSGKSITKSAISHWEKGINVPSLHSLMALCELFSVPADYFFEPQPNYLLEGLANLNLHQKIESIHQEPGANVSRKKVLNQDDPPPSARLIND